MYKMLFTKTMIAIVIYKIDSKLFTKMVAIVYKYTCQIMHIIRPTNILFRVGIKPAVRCTES